VKGTIYIFC